MSVSNQKHSKKAPYKGPYFTKHQYDLMKSLWQMGLNAWGSGKSDHCKLFTIESVTKHHGWVGEGVCKALASKGFIYFEWFETNSKVKHVQPCDPNTCRWCERLWTIRLTPKAIAWFYSRSELDPDCDCGYCYEHSLDSNGWNTPGWRNNPHNPANKPNPEPEPEKRILTHWERIFGPK